MAKCEYFNWGDNGEGDNGKNPQATCKLVEEFLGGAWWTDRPSTGCFDEDEKAAR